MRQPTINETRGQKNGLDEKTATDAGVVYYKSWATQRQRGWERGYDKEASDADGAALPCTLSARADGWR